jgi:tetratricopeptide (TPR) repeat protein
VLEWALAQPGADPVAAYALGNALYDAKRQDEALAAWQQSVDAGANFPTVFRNLGIARWNLHRDGDAATNAYLRAMELDPADPRLVSEFDQLQAKLNTPPAQRLAFLESHQSLVLERDDCTVALATLHNLLGAPEKALALLTSRRFHPWEGGEGSVLRQFTTAKLLLGQAALAAGNPAAALAEFSSAMDTPESLGEAYHLLQAKADVNYWTGMALKALGRTQEAMVCFESSASEAGDFSEMAVTAHSPLSWFRGLSLRELGRADEARALFEDLRNFATRKLAEPATIDYFATSLPNLLVFEEDLLARRQAEAQLLLALAYHGLGDTAAAKSALQHVLAFNQADPYAVELSHALRPHSS